MSVALSMNRLHLDFLSTTFIVNLCDSGTGVKFSLVPRPINYTLPAYHILAKQGTEPNFFHLCSRKRSFLAGGGGGGVISFSAGIDQIGYMWPFP